ncbi:conserved hypothetical protein [Candidatus Protochlamydia naegleriophila]|uniref:Uncharacterized protein n=1 Tax=Candidatus Protochlamydia naegleriophila TaxID=389348 RepID=A0A0U5K4A8_9BACT|nr:hypothetical protein [Candidatus Protochlamydia naegleriophila]CUI16923.1 conserved hypothetical protein [Candidatus Protochlamydia naegleriophila]
MKTPIRHAFLTLYALLAIPLNAIQGIEERAICKGCEIYEWFELTQEPVESLKTRLLSPAFNPASPSTSVWTQITPFLIPSNHAAKIKLDDILSNVQAFYDLQSMEAASFDKALPQHHTQIIVTRHPELKGYVIKAYLDVQDYHSGKPEYYFWIKRILGAELIRQAIASHGYGHLLKVPHKWIYQLPDNGSNASNHALKKYFILVEEDMDLYDDAINVAFWGSEWVTNEYLEALYTIVTELGLFDCTKPANCPISKDGRIAFVDTQSFHAKRVKYQKLTPYLSPTMQAYWLELIAGNK